MSYTIRALNSYAEMISVRQLQHDIWGFTDPEVGIYPPILNTAAKNGGVVLGAFDDETGRMVGFLFSFLGRESGGPLKLCSQAMGVLKGWRGRGIARSLKLEQRERALAQDLPLITWTYDPLETPNANLNLHKLRAVTRTYWRDVYGSDFGKLNAGLPSDRLLVEWWIAGRWLDRGQALEWWEATPILEVEGSGDNRRIVRANLALTEDMLQLEVPADIRPVKAADMELAFDWRMKIRQVFESYFEKGYLATDFITTFEAEERRNRYILQKATPALLAEIRVVT
jgi:predicted GNAT superfamily acetyltransferase